MQTGRQRTQTHYDGLGRAIIDILVFQGRDFSLSQRAWKGLLTSLKIFMKIEGRGLKVKLTNLLADLFEDEVI